MTRTRHRHGGAVVIDDRTLPAARVNPSAYLLLQRRCRRRFDQRTDR
ncbi:hypothetical protein ACNRBS_02375 [Ralstonia pseudosolanacearum]|nr:MULTISPECIES: hypothetical protein [Ralstonia]UZF27748.1 hypothetical protein LGV80_19280 [Ralstonia sp. RS642]